MDRADEAKKSITAAAEEEGEEEAGDATVYGTTPLLQMAGGRAAMGLDDYLLQFGVLLAGVLAGLYFIFSVCVMPALAKLDASISARVMNEINVVIINPYFIFVFMAGPAVCVALLVNLYFQPSLPNGTGATAFWLQFAGSMLLIIGEFGITVAANVPLNNALAKEAEDGGDQQAAAFFAERFLRPWTTWNSVRCMASVGTVLCFALALRLK